MNTKTKRLLNAMAVVLCNENDELIKKLHNVIADKRDGYDYDFIATVNSFRCLLANAKRKTGVLETISKDGIKQVTIEYNDYLNQWQKQAMELNNK